MTRPERSALVFPSFITRDEDWAAALLVRDASLQRFNRLARIQFLRLVGPLFDAQLDLAEITWCRSWDQRTAAVAYRRNDGTEFSALWAPELGPMIREIESFLHEPGVNMFAWCADHAYQIRWHDEALKPYSARCRAALAAEQLKMSAHRNRAAP